MPLESWSLPGLSRKASGLPKPSTRVWIFVLLLSPSNDHASRHAIPLLGQIKIDGSNILGDKAYGAKAIRDYINSQGAAYTIPPKSDVNYPWPVDWHTYKERHLVECFFQKLKWFHRIFTRYDKLDDSFLAFVYLAAIVILLK